MPIFRLTFYATDWSLEDGFVVQFREKMSFSRMYRYAYKVFRRCYPKESRLPFSVFFEDLR